MEFTSIMAIYNKNKFILNDNICESKVHKFLDAVKQSNLSMIGDLLKDEPLLTDIVAEDGLSVLLYAAHAESHGQIRGVSDLLLDRGASMSLHSAAALGNEKFLRRSLLTSFEGIDSRDEWGMTPLMWASHCCHSGVAWFLLQNGADVNAQDKFGWSALHIACELGHIEIVKLLLENNADPRKKLTKVGYEFTPLDLAVMHKRKNVVNFFSKTNRKEISVFSSEQGLAMWPRKIFISYARENYEEASTLYKDLKCRGHEPWLDQIELLPGQQWQRNIKEAIQNSDFYLLFISKIALSKTGFVRREINYALEVLDQFPPDKIYFIPVLLENIKIPLEFKHIHCIDISTNRAEGLKKIIAAIEH